MATGNESVPKIMINDTIYIFFLNCNQTITVSEYRLIKLLPFILFEKIYQYFSNGNGQPRQPALCQLYRHAFVPYGLTTQRSRIRLVAVSLSGNNLRQVVHMHVLLKIIRHDKRCLR